MLVSFRFIHRMNFNRVSRIHVQGYQISTYLTCSSQCYVVRLWMNHALHCVGFTWTLILRAWYVVYLAWHPGFNPTGERKWIEVCKSMGLKKNRWLIMIWHVMKSWYIHWLNRWAQVDLCTTIIYWSWCTVHKAVWGLGVAQNVSCEAREYILSVTNGVLLLSFKLPVKAVSSQRNWNA